MPKRKNDDTSNVVRKALAVNGATDKACFQLLQLGQQASAETLPRSLSCFQTAVGKELPKDMILKVPLNEGKDGKELYVSVTDLKAYLNKRAKDNQQFGECLRQCMIDSKLAPLKMILYFDEAQAGNILSPSSKKKLLFGYVAIVELGMLQSQDSWFDLCAFSHASINEVQGGWSRLIKEVILTLLGFDLKAGFPIVPKQGDPFWCRIELACLTGDFDALRCLYDWRGASSIKLCLTCKNVVSTASRLAAFSPILVDQTEDDIAKFSLWTDQELCDLWDKPLHAPARTQQLRESEEKAAGFNIYNRLALLSDPTARQAAAVSKVVFDPMHLYYSNGICSWEVVQIIQALKPHGLTPELIGQSFGQTNWRSASTKSGPKWYKDLMAPQRFTTDTYKGSASDLKALMPLLHFHLASLPGLQQHVTLELVSLEALLRITRCLYEIEFQGPKSDLLEELSKAQLWHHRAYIKAYTESSLKPKHHFSRHLPMQIAKAGVYVTCFGMESKHQHFKYGLQNRLDSQLKDTCLYANRVLQRLLLHGDEMFRSRGFPGHLLPPTKQVQLAHQFGTASNGFQLEHGKVLVNEFIVTSLGSGMVKSCYHFDGIGLAVLLETYVLAAHPQTVRAYIHSYLHKHTYIHTYILNAYISSSVRPLGLQIPYIHQFFCAAHGAANCIHT